MGSFKQCTDTLMSYLQGMDHINTVTFGDASEFDTSKATNYPLAHLIPVSTLLTEGFTSYSYQILFTNIYRSSKDDKIEVMDRMAQAVEILHKALDRGSLFDSQIRTGATNTADPIYDERQNRVYGWSLSLEVTVLANIEVCV